MESENGVTVEEEIIVSEKTDIEESATEEKKKEHDDADADADINGEGDSNSKQEETKSEGKTSKAPANVSKTQMSRTLKVPYVSYIQAVLFTLITCIISCLCMCLFLCIGAW